MKHLHYVDETLSLCCFNKYSFINLHCSRRTTIWIHQNDKRISLVCWIWPVQKSQTNFALFCSTHIFNSLHCLVYSAQYPPGSHHTNEISASAYGLCILTTPLSLTHAMFLTWSKWLGSPSTYPTTACLSGDRHKHVHVGPLRRDTEIWVRPRSTQKRQWILATLVTTALWWPFLRKIFFFFVSLPPSRDGGPAGGDCGAGDQRGARGGQALVPHGGEPCGRPISRTICHSQWRTQKQVGDALNLTWTTETRYVFFLLYKRKIWIWWVCVCMFIPVSVRCVAEFCKCIVWHSCYPQPSSMVGLNSNIGVIVTLEWIQII